jgi:hypothetical protein
LPWIFECNGSCIRQNNGPSHFSQPHIIQGEAASIHKLSSNNLIVIQCHNVALIISDSKQQVIAIGTNHCEHIFISDADLSLKEEWSEVVVVENRGGAVVRVSEVDHGLCFVDFLEIGVEVLTGCDGEGCSELPDTDGIGGVERVDKDSIVAEANEIAGSKRDHPAANLIQIKSIIIDPISLEEVITSLIFLHDRKNNRSISSAVVNYYSSSTLRPPTTIVVIGAQLAIVIFIDDVSIVDEVPLEERCA